MGDWEDTVARDVRANVPRVIAQEVLKTAIASYKNAPKIGIVTPNYPAWLQRADPKRRVPIKDSVKDFRRRGTEYNDWITRLLDFIYFYDAGTAMIEEISSSQCKLFIRPFTVFGEKGEIASYTTPIGEKGAGDPEAVLNATAVGMPHYGQSGKLLPGSGRGIGANAVIDFSPGMWLEEAGRKLFSGPGSQLDEILFHEMVHAARMVRGVAFSVPVNQGYENEEEYLSVVLTNVYMSEKGQNSFRARHIIPNTPLQQKEKFLDNVQNVNMPPIYLIERFRLSTPHYYRSLANIPAGSASFNPIREFDERRNAGTLKLY